MAYQNVGTPRFYIDHYQYLKSIGFKRGLLKLLLSFGSFFEVPEILPKTSDKRGSLTSPIIPRLYLSLIHI